MDIIEYEEKEYSVTDRVASLITMLDITEYAALILSSKNYQEGKIAESILLAALIDQDDINIRTDWVDMLTSEIYGAGLISYDVASKLANCGFDMKWALTDKKYKKGIIKDEHLKHIFEMINTDDEYCSHCEQTVNIMVTMLTSEEYENGNFSDETINLFLATSGETRCDKIDILDKLFAQERNTISFLNDEKLKLILETKNPLVDRIIYYILKARFVSPELKEQYILAMLNIENQEGLTAVYNSYVEKSHTNLNGFAQNFVEHTLPILHELDLQVSYTRKRTNNSI